MTLVHHHLIYQANVDRSDLDENTQDALERFLHSLVKEIGMQVLISPQVKFSHQKAWTGLTGIITSHIAFHYWTIEQYVQLDIYSCKEFDKQKALEFLNKFWVSSNVKALFIDRKIGKDFHFEVLS